MPDGLHHQVLEGCTVETKDALIAHVAATHTAVSVGIVEYFERYRRNVYVTPRTFLSFLTTYLETYGQKRDGVAQLASSINIGLEKLAQVIHPLSAADDDGCTHRVRPHSSSTTTDRLSLAQATEDVDIMKVELKKKGIVLLDAQQKSALLLQDITASTARAEKKKSEVQAVKDKLSVEAAVRAPPMATLMTTDAPSGWRRLTTSDDV